MADDSRPQAWRGGYPGLCPEERTVHSGQGDSVTLACVMAAGHVPPHWDLAQLIWWDDPIRATGAEDGSGARHGGPSGD